MEKVNYENLNENGSRPANIAKLISSLIDDDLLEADFEKARYTCDLIEEEINRVRNYMDAMDKLADS